MGVVGEGMVALGMLVVVAHGTSGGNGPLSVGALIAQVRIRLRGTNKSVHTPFVLTTSPAPVGPAGVGRGRRRVLLSLVVDMTRST